MLLNDAQTLLDKKNIINEITLRTDDYNKAEQYAAQIETISGYKTESWQESNANFLKIFRIQTIITYIITGALLVVAAFGVLNILIMAVLERVNDIAILKSFGLSRGDITQIYVFQGLVIGISRIGRSAWGSASWRSKGLRRLADSGGRACEIRRPADERAPEPVHHRVRRRDGDRADRGGLSRAAGGEV